MRSANQDTATAKPKRQVAVVSDREGFRELVRTSLSASPDLEVVGVESARVLSPGRPLRADLIVLDVGEGELLEDDALFAFREGCAGVPLIAVSTELPPKRLRRIVQLAAADWLIEPVSGRALLESVARQFQSASAPRLEVSAFVPCSGGAGATSLAISAAAHRASQAPGGVFLVDLDFAAGACGLYLDLENEFDIASILRDPSRIDVELLDVLKKDHPAGFSVLSFRRPELPVGAVAEDFIYRLLDVVTFRAPQVVIDMPSYPTPWSDPVLLNSDRIFLVAERTVPSLKRARALRERLAAQGKAAGSIGLIVNKDRRALFRTAVGPREIQSLLAIDRLDVLPDDHAVMVEAIDRGVPAAMVSPRASIVRKLAQALDSPGRSTAQPRRLALGRR